MKPLFDKLNILTKHFLLLDKTFRKKSNYSSSIDFEIYSQNERIIKRIAKQEKLKTATLKIKSKGTHTKSSFSFVDEIYSESSRQMKLADIIEYMLFSRGVYYLFQGNQFKTDRVSKFIELNLRLVNILMIYESLTVDKKLRTAFLKNLKPIIGKEMGFKQLLTWKTAVGLDEKNPKYKKTAPNIYFDTLLPKTAGGLWHEILVFCFILKYNIGYIFPLLLTQKPISLVHKLSPPDLVIMHNKTYRFYGIEIGTLKERQSGGFMAPSGIPIIPIDTLNSRASDRCPTCNKWIGLCPKVIQDFSKNIDSKDNVILTNEIRCLTECNLYSLEEKLNGNCKYMKFRYKNTNWKYPFTKGKHHHYHCCVNAKPSVKQKIKNINSYDELKKLDVLLQKTTLSDTEIKEKVELQAKLKSKFPFIKTHSVYYSELSTLFKMCKDDSNIDSVEDSEEENAEE